MASISQKRIDGHRKEAYAKTDGDWNNKSRCKKAIRKFGWDNVQVEIMEFVPKWTSLRNRERYWIAQYQSWKEEYGYNSNKGGGGTIAGAYKHTDESKEKISKPVTCCKVLEDGATHQKVRLTYYSSARAAEANTKVSHTNISKCCHKKYKSAGGRFWWHTKDDDVFDKDIILPRIGMPQVPIRYSEKAIISVLVLQSGKALEQWHSSINGAVRTLCQSGKKICYSKISLCCSKKRSKHQGYHFRRVTDEKIEDFKDNKRIVKYQPELYTTTKKRKRE